MRLDRFLSEQGIMSRREAAKAAKGGRITVNGDAVRSADIRISEETDTVAIDGAAVEWRRFVYIMLSKPEGYISATDDPREKTVLELISERDRKIGLFPCGRLDKDSTGLMLLTNDGALAHRLLSPKYHCEKRYIVNIAKPIEDEGIISRLESGVDIGGEITRPAKFTPMTPTRFEVTLREGRYHQIKRMFESVGNKVVTLRRVSFAGIELDPRLKSGEWRYLTDDEISALRAAAGAAEAGAEAGAAAAAAGAGEE